MVEGDAGRGEGYLASCWLTKEGGQEASARILTMRAGEVQQLLADLDTAAEHAKSVFEIIRKLRRDVNWPPS